MKFQLLTAAVAAAISMSAVAAPVTYTIDSGHTFPSFEADHKGGLSIWRGKFNKTSGSITLDRAAKTGSVDITVDATSIDFGHDKLNAHVSSADMLDVAKFPTATFKSTKVHFNGDAPASIDGEFTLHGVTKPLTLTVNKFKCVQDNMTKREVCGADASATFNRADYGVNYGEKYGFNMDVKLAIQVEAAEKK